MSKPLPPKPCLEQLKNQAKTLLHACQAGDATALGRMREHLPRLGVATEVELRQAEVCLKEAQHVIAREHGFANWDWLRVVVEADLELIGLLTDRETQALLGEVDLGDLVVALTGVSEAAQAKVLGNMSTRLRARAEQEMGVLRLAEQEHKDWVDKARRLLQRVAALAAQGQIEWPNGAATTPAAPARVADAALLEAVRRPLEEIRPEQLADLAWAIAEQARKAGILSLEPVAAACVNPYLGAGLRMVVDYTEPDLVTDILDTRWQAGLQPGLLTRGRMIIEAVMAIRSGDYPQIVHHKALVFRYEEPGQAEPVVPVPATDLAARLQETPVARMSLEGLAAVLTQMAFLARQESLDVLAPLAAATDSSLLRLGLQLLCRRTAPDQMVRQLEAHLAADLQQAGARHRMVSTMLRSLQDGKTPDEVRTAARQVAAG